MNYISKQYLVGGHLFRLSLPDDQALWDLLEQYSPFETGQKGGELFCFELVPELPHGELTVVLDIRPEEGFTSITLSRDGSDWLFELKSPSGIAAAMMVSDDFSQARFCPHTTRPREIVAMMNTSLMLLYAFSACPFGTLEIHASVVSNGGRAYLFLGKSGTGKSTHSSLWLKNIPGTELMNDDNPIIRVMDDGTVMAYGSPWSGKTACYRNVEAPVGAFVQIRQSKKNKATAMNVLEGYAALYSSCSGFKSEKRFADDIHPTLEKVVTTIPFYYMDCRPDDEAAEICHEAVCR